MNAARRQPTAAALALAPLLSRNFYMLSVAEVCDVLAQADAYGYRKPRNANGSRARYFFAYVQRFNAAQSEKVKP